jgi:hypothetical protein
LEGSGQDAVPGRDFGVVLRSKSDLQVLTVPDIPAIAPYWQPISADGDFAVFAGRTRRPRLEFQAIRVRLNYAVRDPGAAEGETDGKEKGETDGETRKAPAQRILIGAGEGNGVLHFGQVPSVRVSSFVRNNGLMAGINAVPFEPSSAREGEARAVVGLGVSDGRLIAAPVPRFDALVFYRDGRAAIVGQWELRVNAPDYGPGGPRTEAGPDEAGTLPPEILHAAGGFHCVLRGGELTERALRQSPRYARSAAGLSADGRTLYLVAINGGRLTQRGATEAETALILKQLGALDALNLDGGGSSALVLRFPAGVSVLNTPAHSGLPGRERAVALCLGIGRG